jgi:hypothetical protein
MMIVALDIIRLQLPAASAQGPSARGVRVSLVSRGGRNIHGVGAAVHEQA